MNSSTASSSTPPSNAISDTSTDAILQPSDTFARRHIGPNADDIKAMLQTLALDSLDELVEETVPESIRLKGALDLHEGRPEFECLNDLRTMANRNRIMRSLIGMGYYDTITPPVILRNILENPGWYTQYTPYQAEISQGRMEALINFQTMVSDLTVLPLANASLLDEGTAAAEAMAMCRSIHEGKRNTFLAAADCHPQTLAVLRTRAESMGIKLVVVDAGGLADAISSAAADLAGVLVQYPNTFGQIVDPSAVAGLVKAQGGLVVVATDLLACTLIKPPGELGADIVVGSAQRFGVPMGFGGPHAGFLSTRTDHARKMPGRIIGVSKDAHGHPAYRLTLQTREQHIRRDRATSNICTAQVLLAIISAMYACYHGPTGLRRIAQRVHTMAKAFATGIQRLGHEIASYPFFDTVVVKLNGLPASSVLSAAQSVGFNLRQIDESSVGLSFDETTTVQDVEKLISSFAGGATLRINIAEFADQFMKGSSIENRTSSYLTHPVFNLYHSEHEMLRYIFKLMSRDLSLAQSMIALGSCTMKLNATSEMIPVTWSEFGRLHPFAPADQTRGYAEMFSQLESWLAEITGFAGVWLQPNAGSQGEYAGLLAIRAYHHSRGQKQRDVCLIPESAHGTNPASAIIAGFKVVPVKCRANGDVDIDDLRAKSQQHKDDLAALMITYPSTHGVFESGIREICDIVHAAGGQVYMDGANMNAQVGLCRPGDFGADVCHLNLHKTFCIPHGGGGPGMGPIGVAKHLVPFIPKPSEHWSGREDRIGAVASAPYGSPSILTISWMYIAMMGAEGLKRATQVAILNANYMSKRLEGHYDILFKGANGRCAHEFIVDCRAFEKSANVKVEDIAKRLMDFGFHAPTMSWPVPGTLMIEPTESESKAELDRFCDAMISIRDEIRMIEQGKLDKLDNPLKNAPHTARATTADDWSHKYSRELAAYPAGWLKDYKFWPSVGRVDNPYGDRHLVCTCPPMDSFK